MLPVRQPKKAGKEKYVHVKLAISQKMYYHKYSIIWRSEHLGRGAGYSAAIVPNVFLSN